MTSMKPAEAYLLGRKDGVKAAVAHVERIAESIASTEKPGSQDKEEQRKYVVAMLRAAADEVRRQIK